LKIESVDKNTMKINFHDMNKARSFSGIQNKNLKMIEESLEVKINSRGNELFFFNEKGEMEKISKFLDKAKLVLDNRRSISSEDIYYLIDNTNSEEVLSDHTVNENGFMITSRGGTIRPKTQGQSEYIKQMENNTLCFAIGPAGTGKTYLAVAYAVTMLKSEYIDRIILTRPVVEAGEKLGFLPGDLQEKVDPYFRPLYDALFEMLGPDKTRKYMERNIIEIAPLAYMRGRTLNRAFVILDEAQNTTRGQMKMFLTRIGENTKAVITGDKTQIDLTEKSNSGLFDIPIILKDIKGIGIVNLKAEDVVRHSLIKKIINAYTEYEDSRG